MQSFGKMAAMGMAGLLLFDLTLAVGVAFLWLWATLLHEAEHG